MKTKLIYLLIISLVSSLFVQAQEQEQESEHVFIFYNPQYLFTNGIRMDIDIRTGMSNKLWVISPYYYSDGSNESFLNRGDDSDYDSRKYESMYGYGLGIARRIFLKSKPTADGFYAQLGITYRYFSVQGDNFTYVKTTGDDGLEYYSMQDIEYSININSYNGSLIIGHQFNPFTKFYIDLYIGFGLRYSTHESPEGAVIKYNRGNIDYGYSGTQFIGGFRLGVNIF